MQVPTRGPSHRSNAAQERPRALRIWLCVAGTGASGDSQKIGGNGSNGRRHGTGKFGPSVVSEGASKLCSQAGRGANGWHSVGTACHAPLLTSSLLSARQLDRLDRREAGIGRRRDAWPVLRPSRTFKRRQPAARPRILHTRRHDPGHAPIKVHRYRKKLAEGHINISPTLLE